MSADNFQVSGNVDYNVEDNYQDKSFGSRNSSRNSPILMSASISDSDCDNDWNQPNKVLITASATINPLGITPEQTFQNMLDGQSGVISLRDYPQFEGLTC